MTPLAVSLKPYLLYLIFVLIFMLSLAIFVGAILIIKRLWKKEPVEGSLIQDREKLAAEIHQEVLRLEDLRNRLDPSFVIEGQDISASPVPARLHTQGAAEAAQPSVERGLSEEQVKERINDATEDLMKEIAELTSKLAEGAKAAKGEATPSEPKASDPQQAKIIDQLKTDVTLLEAKLEDYRAFEDELALVRSLKEENEKLRAEMEANRTASDTSLGINEADIASLFEEMGASFDGDDSAPVVPEASVPLEADSEDDELARLLAAGSAEDELPSEEALVEDIVAAALSEGDVESDGRLEPSLDSAESIFSAEPEAPKKGFVKEATSSEPALPQINAENAEAMAELGEDEDELMAEFEKVLGTKEQEKNS